MDRAQELAGTFDRRQAQRCQVVLASRVESPLRSRVAVTRDISRTGAMLLAAGRYRQGDLIELAVLPLRSDAEIHVRGRVMRTEPSTVGGPWRSCLAVRFDDPLPVEDAQLLGTP